MSVQNTYLFLFSPSLEIFGTVVNVAGWGSQFEYQWIGLGEKMRKRKARVRWGCSKVILDVQNHSNVNVKSEKFSGRNIPTKSGCFDHILFSDCWTLDGFRLAQPARSAHGTAQAKISTWTCYTFLRYNFFLFLFTFHPTFSNHNLHICKNEKEPSVCLLGLG